MDELQRMRQAVDEYRKEHPDFQATKYTATTPQMLETYDCIDKAVRPVLTRYTLLVLESGNVQPVDTTKLEAYAAELEPIKLCDCGSLRTKARVLQGALHTAARRDEYGAPELARRLYMMLEGSEGLPVC